ncbi:MAG: MBL fold metallo-hydrolase [Deltaproteobacteria bacterium]|nr:MBL fold metallo-hydrolase [Deltaproteobacteria bacterium]
MADKVRVSVVVDNTIDIFLPPAEHVSYPLPGSGSRLLAEQGLSLAVEVWNGERVTRILYDFGRNADVCLFNAALLEIAVSDLDYLVLSHGHVDHYGALRHIIGEAEGSRLVVHPDALDRKRYILVEDKEVVGPWEVASETLRPFESRISVNTDPFFIAPDIAVSGEIERQTDFEEGMHNALVEVDGELVHDEIRDDQALFIDLDEGGIVVLTGCCHAGLVNTLLSAQKVLPGRPVHALIGGLHLNSAGERQMKETMGYLQELNLSCLAALHCTGYYAGRRLMERFRDPWIAGTVGARISLGGSHSCP